MTLNCTGCNLRINGVQVTPGVDWTVGNSTTVLGQGNGVFSGVSNFDLGLYEFLYAAPEHGACHTGQTGQSGQTGCTGVEPCTAKVKVRFTPNPFLAQIAPGYQGTLTQTTTEGVTIVYNYTYTTSVFETNAYYYTGACGTLELDRSVFNVTLAPYSGSIGATVTTDLLCTACTGQTGSV